MPGGLEATFAGKTKAPKRKKQSRSFLSVAPIGGGALRHGESHIQNFSRACCALSFKCVEVAFKSFTVM